ncbi:MAG TPA: class III extradiol dioxygenase subunit B-like domain-containing protein [Candidatus Saccharimonadales bacterium]|nr:class III extradiol dioxygenase subunit B-like domain-containing protein [Candidatus Saccharimonadales bacterium]
MPLIKAFLFPHSPLLIPEIGRANHEFLTKTVIAYQKAKTDFLKAGIETVIVISPHNRIKENFFTLNAAPEMEISFPDFGFIPPKNFLKGDVILSDKIKNNLKGELPLRSLSDNTLDYGSAIPLYLLKTPDTNFKVLVVSPADDLDLKENFNFGLKLAAMIAAESKKIAIVVSGDLSHRLKRKSPGGYSPKGAKFDNKLIEYLSDPENAKKNILSMDKHLIDEASECGLKPLVILLGILDKINWEPDILAYQTDFGVGYLSLEFLLPNTPETI